MKRYVKPETINILGGSQAAGSQTNRRSEHQAQPEPEPSRWEKFKTKATRVWNTFMNVARDIKETIIPIVTCLVTLRVGLATCRNRNNQYGGCTA